MNEGRKKAEKAKENIPEIRRLIASANNRTAKAVEEIGNAEDDAEKAADLAENALKLSDDTTEVRTISNVYSWLYC